MATRALACPYCRAWFEAPGRSVRCPSCDRRFDAESALLENPRPEAAAGIDFTPMPSGEPAQAGPAGADASTTRASSPEMQTTSESTPEASGGGANLSLILGLVFFIYFLVAPRFLDTGAFMIGVALLVGAQLIAGWSRKSGGS